MADKLKDAFHAYTKSFQAKLQKRSKRSIGKGPVQLHPNKALELQTAVTEAESEAEFQHLIAETRSQFLEDFHGKSESAWQDAVKNCFRRSDYYVDLSEGKTPDKETFFSRYCDAFQRRERQATYLAPLEFVYFAKESMDFGSFQVRRFSSNELEVMLQNRVNRVFYTWATVDTPQLCNYWFVCVTAKVPIQKLGYIYFSGEALSRVKMEYSRHPKVITDALQTLALFDWQASWWENSSHNPQQHEDLEIGWLGFEIPFVLETDDNWLGSPRGTPDLSRLHTEPLTNSATGDVSEEEVPTTYIHFDERETDLFQTSVQDGEKLLTNLRVQQHPWGFIDVALGYFIKAFFTEGHEQLLWHITTLEALVGEKGEGITKRLAGRIALILGKTENERKKLRKEFNELYEFRSALVHGKQSENRVYIGHLRNARDLARRTLLWFIYYLDHIQSHVPPGQPVAAFPNREEILMLVDMKKETRTRLREVIEKLPEGFPNVSEWMR